MFSVAKRYFSYTAKLDIYLERGTVRWFDRHQGFGFIERIIPGKEKNSTLKTEEDLYPGVNKRFLNESMDDDYIFVQYNDIESVNGKNEHGTLKYLRPGQLVEYYADVVGPRGSRCARHVIPVE